MFGELIGLWCADLWRQMGRPDPVHLMELGPGRGTLMADAWRATQAQPGFHQAVRLSLVEISAPLRARQRRRLAGVRPGSGPHWLDELAEAPPGPLLLIANELLDALAHPPVPAPGRRLARAAGRPRAERHRVSPGPGAQRGRRPARRSGGVRRRPARRRRRALPGGGRAGRRDRPARRAVGRGGAVDRLRLQRERTPRHAAGGCAATAAIR